MTSPRAAAVAGILFSLLIMTSLVMIRITVPANPQDAGAWLSGDASTITLAVHLLPLLASPSCGSSASSVIGWSARHESLSWGDKPGDRRLGGYCPPGPDVGRVESVDGAARYSETASASKGH